MTPPLRVRWLLALTLVGCYHPPTRPVGEAGPRVVPPSEPTRAPEPVPSGQTTNALGCEAAVARVLRMDATLEAARAGLPVARTARRAAGRLPDPEVRLSDNVRDLGQETRVDLRFRIDPLGSGSAEKAAAEAGERLSEAETAALEVDVARETRVAFADVRFRERRLETLRAEVAALRADAQLAEERARAGLITAVALEEARLGLAASESALSSAERSQVARVRALELRVGAPVDPAGACMEPVAPAAQAGATSPPPDVRAAWADADAADAEAFVEARSAWVWPTYAQVSWSRDKAGNNREDRILVEVGIALPWPGTDGGDVAEARARHAEATASALQRQAASRLETAEATLAGARADREAIQALRPAVELSRALLEKGRSVLAPASDLAALAKRLRQYELSVADAEQAIAVAEADVLAARGLASLQAH